MTMQANAAWESPGERFGRMLDIIVRHQGLDAESQLIEFLGKDRLIELYGGEEPRLGELTEISRILNVPLSTFQVVEPGAFPDLEIAFADVLHSAASASDATRLRLAEKISELAYWARQENTGPNVTDSLLGTVRRSSP